MTTSNVVYGYIRSLVEEMSLYQVQTVKGHRDSHIDGKVPTNLLVEPSTLVYS